MQLKIDSTKKSLSSFQIASIKKAIEATFERLKIKRDWQINLAFVSKKQSQELNFKYASNNYPTDVLSFNYQDGGKTDLKILKYMGDIAICLPIAKAQAKIHDISLTEELRLLSIHAVLHLLGYDHKSQSQKARFDQLLSDIINSLN